MKSIAEMQIENCYGCGGCEKVCPKSAISMRDINGEGFLYPVLDNNKCIECGLCTKKCPALVRYKGEQTFYPHSFAIKSNSDIAEKSSSAGVFSVFAEYMHSKGGWVCGAVYDEEAHSKMKFSIIGTLMILETAKTLWSENMEAGKMAAVLEAAKRYSREVEHSDENIELLEKLSRREGVFGLDSLLTGILN